MEYVLMMVMEFFELAIALIILPLFLFRSIGITF
jgi:hypothetical protein